MKVELPGAVTTVAFGGYHSIVKISKGNQDLVYSWGWNEMGQCGQGLELECVKIGEVMGYY
jgi:alpha-tubulin suppressor-like RCC1 family protein